MPDISVEGTRRSGRAKRSNESEHGPILIEINLIYHIGIFVKSNHVCSDGSIHFFQFFGLVEKLTVNVIVLKTKIFVSVSVF